MDGIHFRLQQTLGGDKYSNTSGGLAMTEGSDPLMLLCVAIAVTMDEERGDKVYDLLLVLI